MTGPIDADGVVPTRAAAPHSRVDTPRRIAVFAGLVGVVCSFLAWAYLADRARREIELQFVRDADERVEAVRHAIDAHSRLLLATTSYFGGSETVDRFEFDAFARPLLSYYDSVVSLQWVPRVTADRLDDFLLVARLDTPEFEILEHGADGGLVSTGSRTETFPVRFAIPQLPSAPIGFDWYSESQVRAAVMAARDAGAIRSPGWVRDRGFVLIAPAYGPATTPTTPAERQAQLLGVVIGVFDADSIVRSAVQRLSDAPLVVRLLDDDHDRSRVMGSTHAGFEIDPDALVHVEAYPMGERRLVVECRALPGYTARGVRAIQWLALAVGLLGTAGIAGYLFSLAGRHSKIEALVAERTAALEGQVEERERTQKTLRASESRFRSLAESAPNAIVTTDAAGLITFFNPGAERIFGRSRHEMLGQSVTGLLPERYRASVEDGLARLVERGESGMFDDAFTIEALRNDGTEFPIDISFGNWEDENSRAAFMAIIRDVTRRVRAERALAEKSTALEDSQRHLREAMELAESANEAKSEFLANMSHEIRTPMNGILGMTRILQESPLRLEQREYAHTIQRSAEALRGLLDDILDFSKIEARRLDLDSIEFALRDCIGDAVQPLAVQAAERGLELACHIGPAVPDALVGDPGRVRQILVNLVGNAIKFTEGGEVVVDVAAAEVLEDSVLLHISVRDTGVGIPRDKQVEIFGAFNQAATSMTRQFGGTGLGLAISSQLAEMMGGRMWVDSDPGAGSTFHFTARFGRREGGDGLRRAEILELRGLRVLVAEHHATQRAILIEMIESWDMQVVSSPDGEDAWRRLGEAGSISSPFDLILLDVTLAGVGGFALARRVRDSSALNRTPMLLLSSLWHPEDVALARSLGVRACLTKPVKQSELLDTIAELVHAGESTATTTRTETVTTPRALEVLLAEDGIVNQKVATKLLELRGHRATVAVNGREAVEMLQAGSARFDIVLMDIRMPVMNGYEATAAIRDQERHTGDHIPIVAMTAHAMKGDRERCLAAGMDGYVRKPIDVDELYRVIEDLARPERGGEVAAVSGVDVVPDPATADGPILDWDAALRRVGGDDEMLRELARDFVIEARRLLEEIRGSIEGAQARELRRAAHTLKGSAGVFGAKPTVRCAQALEQIGFEQRLDEAGPAFTALEEALEPLLVELARRGAGDGLGD